MYIPYLYCIDSHDTPHVQHRIERVCLEAPSRTFEGHPSALAAARASNRTRRGDGHEAVCRC